MTARARFPTEDAARTSYPPSGSPHPWICFSRDELGISRDHPADDSEVEDSRRIFEGDLEPPDESQNAPVSTTRGAA